MYKLYHGTSPRKDVSFAVGTSASVAYRVQVVSSTKATLFK